MIDELIIGLAGGVVAGMLGVGGGVIFVPGMILLLNFGQVDAEATSLLAIIPVAIVGAYRQHGYGNVRVKDGMIIGALACGGAVGGVAIANAVPTRALELGFAAFTLFVAAQLARDALTREEDTDGRAPPDIMRES
jgi:uncharacterized membrane protein YfcA